MPDLVTPHAGVRESYLQAMVECQAEGRGGPADDAVIGAEIREFAASWPIAEGFAAFADALRAQSLGEHLPAGFVRCTTLWWAAADTYFGRIANRHD